MLSLIVRQAGGIARRSTPLLSPVRYKAAYEGEGKTTVQVLNQDQELGLMIDSYATYGFRLNNGITVLGPMAIFPRTVLSWQVRGSDEITEESLRLFKLLEPKIDLLIMGIEANERSIMGPVFRAAKANKLNVEILPTEHACSTFNFLNAEGRFLLSIWSIMGPVFRAAKANKLNVAILPTEHACSTFNFLNVEGRCVAAALIPPTHVTMTEDDQLRTSLHYQNLYEKDI